MTNCKKCGVRLRPRYRVGRPREYCLRCFTEHRKAYLRAYWARPDQLRKRKLAARVRRAKAEEGG